MFVAGGLVWLNLERRLQSLSDNGSYYTGTERFERGWPLTSYYWTDISSLFEVETNESQITQNELVVRENGSGLTIHVPNSCHNFYCYALDIGIALAILLAVAALLESWIKWRLHLISALFGLAIIVTGLWLGLRQIPTTDGGASGLISGWPFRCWSHFQSRKGRTILLSSSTDYLFLALDIVLVAALAIVSVWLCERLVRRLARKPA